MSYTREGIERLRREDLALAAALDTYIRSEPVFHRSELFQSALIEGWLAGRWHQMNVDSRLDGVALRRALVEAHDLLDQHEPAWYTMGHDKRIKAALAATREGNG